MAQTATSTRKIHEGRNIKRFREMLGIKQDALAYELGDDWNQQKISLLEQKESIETELLQQVSAILKIPVEAIQNLVWKVLTNPALSSETTFQKIIQADI